MRIKLVSEWKHVKLCVPWINLYWPFAYHYHALAKCFWIRHADKLLIFEVSLPSSFSLLDSLGLKRLRPHQAHCFMECLCSFLLLLLLLYLPFLCLPRLCFLTLTLQTDCSLFSLICPESAPTRNACQEAEVTKICDFNTAVKYTPFWRVCTEWRTELLSLGKRRTALQSHWYFKVWFHLSWLGEFLSILCEGWA